MYNNDLHIFYKILIFLKAIFALLVLVLFSLGHVDAVHDAETDKLFGIINSYRVGNGHAVLAGDSLLQNAANWMSNDIVLNCVPNGFSCSHTDSLGRTVNTRLRAFGYPAGTTSGTTLGVEILVWGTNGFSTAEKAFGWWRNSSVHNANMLSNSYKAIGISRTCKGNYCAWSVTFGGKVIQDYIFSPILSTSSIPLSNSTPVLTAAPTPTVIPQFEVSPFWAETPTPIPTLESTPAPTITSVLSPIPEPENFPQGALVREKGGEDVYIIKYTGIKKFKRLILSPSVFTNYGNLKWDDIKDVDRSVLDSFQTSDLVRSEGDTKVYKLSAYGDVGEKRWIETAEIFTQFGFDWDAIYEINVYDRDSYLTGVNWQ